MRNSKPKMPKRHGVYIAQLEDRVMLSATPLAAALTGAEDTLSADGSIEAAAQLNPVVTQTEPADGTIPDQRADELSNQFQLNSPIDRQQDVCGELVIIGPSADDYQQLVDDLLNNDDETRVFEVFVLDPNGDGVNQVSDILAGYDDLDAIHRVSYAGNDGTQNWTGAWQELGELDGPSSGLVEADGSPAALEIGGQEVDITGHGVSREANVGNASSATLTFDYWMSNFDGVKQAGAGVLVEVSGDGGSTWTTLDTYALDSSLPTSPTPASFDISAYASSNTQIRFIGNGKVEAFFNADNVSWFLGND